MAGVRVIPDLIANPRFRLASAKHYYYHYDGLGSIIALTDENGRVVEKYEYDVFGAPKIRTASDQTIPASLIDNPYMFTGRQFDLETANYYYRARYYSPSLGRFLQTDPIGYKAGLNLYTYCRNNSIILVDPYGFLGFGLGYSLSGGGGAGGTFGGQFVFDLHGNLGIYVYAGAGAYISGSGSEMGEVSVFSGDISDLSGPSSAYGGGGGEVLGAIGEINISRDSSYKPKLAGSGMTVHFGGYEGIPVEAHGFAVAGQVFQSSEVVSAKIVKDYWTDVGKKTWNNLKSSVSNSVAKLGSMISGSGSKRK